VRAPANVPANVPANSRRLLPLAVLLAACSSGPGVPYAGEDLARSPSSPGGAPADERPVLDLQGAAPTAAPPAEADPRGRIPAGEDPVVAEVAGVPVRASEVARFLFRYDAGRALECLNQIIDARIMEADAAERGLSAPPEEVTARVEVEVRAREQETRVQFGPGVSLDAWLREHFGFTLESYRRDLAVLMRLQCLKDRLVRFEAAREERIRIRVLVVGTEEEARDAQRRLRDGADFSALARQVSLVAPEDLPTYRREEIRPPELAEELFAMPPGGISRPVRVAKGGKELFEVFKVVERTPARDAAWPELAKEIEKGIRDRPVGVAEYLQWARRARQRHGVKVFLEEPAAETPK